MVEWTENRTLAVTLRWVLMDLTLGARHSVLIHILQLQDEMGTFEANGVAFSTFAFSDNISVGNATVSLLLLNYLITYKVSVPVAPLPPSSRFFRVTNLLSVSPGVEWSGVLLYPLKASLPPPTACQTSSGI